MAAMAQMDVAQAREVLGVVATADRLAVRAAYRDRIRAAHPDLAGPSRTREAARLNEAYATLLRAERQPPPVEPSAPPAPAAPTTPPATTPGTTPGAEVSAHGLNLPWPIDEAFTRVIEAGHDLGEVTYVDRGVAIAEVIVDVDGEACSLVLWFHATQRTTLVRATLEALERVATLDPGPVLAILAYFLSEREAD
jgi:hypothetical protein